MLELILSKIEYMQCKKVPLYSVYGKKENVIPGKYSRETLCCTHCEVKLDLQTRDQTF